VRLLDHSGRRAFGGGLGPTDSLTVRTAPDTGVVVGQEPFDQPASVPVAADSSLAPAAGGEAAVDTTRAPRP